MVGYWHGYLSGARCRFAYGPADATATHCLLLLDFIFLVPAHWVVPEKGPLNGCVCVCVNTINGPIVVDLLLVTVKIKHKDDSSISSSLNIFCYKHVLETTSAVQSVHI